jgi:alpha-glucosidase (family GH31 glycosyl hydrolase)
MTFSIEIPLLPGECWWGGVAADGVKMPFPAGYVNDMQDPHGNQANPLLVSSRGRYLWSEAPFRFEIHENRLTASGSAPLEQFNAEGAFTAEETLRGAVRAAAQKHFRLGAPIPDPLLFTAPQYNLWIELLYTPTQTRVLDYAEHVLALGMPPGVLMIDTKWHEEYGNLTFDAGRFPDPRGMIQRLHDMGFKVMLWVSPFITPDCLIFRQLRDKRYLVKAPCDPSSPMAWPVAPQDTPAIVQWWDGYSAMIDLFNPRAFVWFQQQMDTLVDLYGVDGFKFDAGDFQFAAALRLPDPPEYCKRWNEMGLHYRLSEFRTAWKTAGEPLMQRLCDKHHRWGAEENGLRSLIPNSLAQGLIGYAYTCPDMIGGGEYQDFPHTPNGRFDPELFVRSAQCAALFPMMQFSAAPWRMLSADLLPLCVDAARLHAKLGPEIVALAEEAARTGEPIMRSMDYVFPGRGYEAIVDQFMLGSQLLCAPVMEKGATTRTIIFPPGMWVGDDGSRVSGPATLCVEAPISRIPHYRKVA